MTTHDETLGWKQRAIKEHILHQEALQKISELSVALDNSKKLLKKNSDYNKYFEHKFYAIEKKYSTQEIKLLNTIAILKTAQQLIQQRKLEAETQNKKHARTNDSLLAQIDLLNAKNSQLKSANTQLKSANTQLKQELETLGKSLHAEELQLASALKELALIKDLSNKQKQELARHNKNENLEEFFVYKVIDSAHQENTTPAQNSGQQ